VLLRGCTDGQAGHRNSLSGGLERELGRVLIGGEFRADNNIGGAGSVPKYFDGNKGREERWCAQALVRKPAFGPHY
jgi:hypothetical protein